MVILCDMKSDIFIMPYWLVLPVVSKKNKDMEFSHASEWMKGVSINQSESPGMPAAPLLVSNSRMQPADATDHRLTELEIKASFNEDLLDQLNQVVVRQQQQIDALLREVAQLRQQIPDAGSAAFRRAGDELPPHY